MSVTFENGETHEMMLEPYSESPCNFIGQLKNVDSSVAVTGCMNKAGDKMHITLLADANTRSTTYELGFDGKVTAQENPFKTQTGTFHVIQIMIGRFYNPADGCCDKFNLFLFFYRALRHVPTQK